MMERKASGVRNVWLPCKTRAKVNLMIMGNFICLYAILHVWEFAAMREATDTQIALNRIRNNALTFAAVPDKVGQVFIKGHASMSAWFVVRRKKRR